MPWALLIIAVIVGGWYWFESRWDRQIFATVPGRVCENLRAHEAMELLRARDDMQVLDVRSAAEFASGALPRAVNVSMSDPDFSKRVSELDKAKPVLVYCAGGYRSRKAVEQLLALGFASIHNLHRGYHSWRLAGNPAVTHEG